MQRDRTVNKSARPLGTFLSRAHPNGGADGDAAENGPLTSRVPEKRDAPTASASQFYI